MGMFYLGVFEYFVFDILMDLKLILYVLSIIRYMNVYISVFILIVCFFNWDFGL